MPVRSVVHGPLLVLPIALEKRSYTCTSFVGALLKRDYVHKSRRTGKAQRTRRYIIGKNYQYIKYIPLDLSRCPL